MKNFEYPEGATPIDDISGLKISWVTTQAHLNMVEAENIALAIEKYLTKSINAPTSWFTVANLQRIHKDMFDDVWDWAGIFRTTQTIPGVRPYQIQSALKDLCDDVFYWNQNGCEMTFLEQAAQIHHRLVLIHPFPNGNGRFSRIVADRYLKGWKCSMPLWPNEIQKESQARKLYIKALRLADAGDYSLLMEFTKKYGGKDPSLGELLISPFYKAEIKKNNLAKLIKANLKHNPNVNETINDHHPLHLAIKQGFKEIVQMLIQTGADLHYKDKSGFTSFELAIVRNQLSIAKMICDHGYPYIPRKPLPPKLLNYYAYIYEFDRRYF
ncbi:MAG: mobile mystery protein B [Parachlamydiales bacterium]|jgi:Fic-DOC domain mobile mystery protein B